MQRNAVAPKKVPRLNSLLYRLQQTPGPEEEPYLDQLMMFLDDPPPGTGDRWIKGAEMCAAWGIPCSHTSVYRLFRSHAAEWRAGLALRADFLDGASVDELWDKTARLASLRVGEILADPASSPATVVNIARIQLSRQKHMEGKGGDAERALKTLANRTWFNPDAQFALSQLRKALEAKRANPLPFPPGFLEAFPQLSSYVAEK